METRLVLDTSVVAKWFSQEEYTEKALRIRQNVLDEEASIIVPDLQVYELSNALRYADLETEDVAEGVKSFLKMGISFLPPIRNVIFHSLKIAFNHDITFYDASFLALSQSLDIPFVTADEKLYRKVSSLSKTYLLKDYKAPAA